MFGLLKFFVFLGLIGVFLWFGSSVKMGKYTLFGHVSRIWHTEAAQDLVEGAKEKAGPAVEKVTRGVRAGLDEATREADGGTRPTRPARADAGPRPARLDAGPRPDAKHRPDAGTRPARSRKRLVDAGP